MSWGAEVSRAAVRAAVYPGMMTAHFARFWAKRGVRDLRDRVNWLQNVARAHQRWINLHIDVVGDVPTGGLVVANHVSYLDVVALSAIGGFGFVAKKEVGKWPIFGACARMGGTVFVDRERRTAVGDAAEELRGHLAGGVPVVLFPEGTSSDGSRVLPFRSSLLEPVVRMECPVTPCGIRYVGGEETEDVAYWGEMTLVPHLMKLMRKRELRVEIGFGETRAVSGERKGIAASLHGEVSRLAGAGSFEEPSRQW